MTLTLASAFLSLLLSGAIFGFFYAWVCSAMWGLDATDPRVAITAMQSINNVVTNAVFAPAFFGTPIALAATAALSFSHTRSAATIFAAAALVYVLGGMVLTIQGNVPLNDMLAAHGSVTDTDKAQQIWTDYSQRWQVFNTLRTIASGIAMLMTGWGLVLLGRASVV